MDPNEPVFPFGDGTLMQMREQSWQFEELGTQMIGGRPVTVASEPVSDPAGTDNAIGDATIALAPAPPPASTAAPADAAPPAGDLVVTPDQLMRIEQQMAELVRAMVTMQRRLDSIDAAIARVVARS